MMINRNLKIQPRKTDTKQAGNQIYHPVDAGIKRTWNNCILQAHWWFKHRPANPGYYVVKTPTKKHCTARGWLRHKKKIIKRIIKYWNRYLQSSPLFQQS